VPSRGRIVPASLVPILLAVLVVVPAVRAAPGVPGAVPPLPVGLDREFLGNLSAPSLNPGGGGSIGYSLADPLPAAMVGTVLSFGVYAFNGFPGNATGTVPVAGAPILTTPTTSGPSANVSIGTLSAGRSVTGSIGIATATTTPSGTFAIRTELTFSSNGSSYRLASRGWFSAAQWANATELPNGSVTLNLSRLGVSGVLPETAVLVTSTDLAWGLFAVAAAGIVLVGAGAWVYFRRTSKSSAGAR
jgi:hypothetical protein